MSFFHKHHAELLRSGIGMTINLQGHPMSVTQCYLAMDSFASFSAD